MHLRDRTLWNKKKKMRFSCRVEAAQLWESQFNQISWRLASEKVTDWLKSQVWFEVKTLQTITYNIKNRSRISSSLESSCVSTIIFHVESGNQNGGQIRPIRHVWGRVSFWKHLPSRKWSHIPPLEVRKIIYSTMTAGMGYVIVPRRVFTFVHTANEPSTTWILLEIHLGPSKHTHTHTPPQKTNATNLCNLKKGVFVEQKYKKNIFQPCIFIYKHRNTNIVM